MNMWLPDPSESVEFLTGDHDDEKMCNAAACRGDFMDVAIIGTEIENGYKMTMEISGLALPSIVLSYPFAGMTPAITRLACAYSPTVSRMAGFIGSGISMYAIGDSS